MALVVILTKGLKWSLNLFSYTVFNLKNTAVIILVNLGFIKVKSLPNIQKMKNTNKARNKC